MRKGRKKIVTLGGGTGSATVLAGLKQHPVKLCAIVTTMDSGGSTGRLVNDLKVHSMGDVRQALVALSCADSSWKDFFNFRFNQGNLKGHNAGNILLAALEKITGDFKKAIEIAKKFLRVSGDIIPVTLEKTDLVTYLENGKKLIKEDSLELLPKMKSSVKKLSLTKKVIANPKAVKAIRAAEIIVVGPGNPCRSILPNFLVTGIAQAVRKSKAKIILVANVMNKKGQTDQMTLSQVVSFYEQYIGKNVIDVVLYNTSRLKKDFIKRNKLKDESVLKIDLKNLIGQSYESIGAPLLAAKGIKQDKADVFLKRTAIRHDPKKIAKIIMDIALG